MGDISLIGIWRSPAPDNDFTYDDLDRLPAVEYLDDSQDTESFTMDDLGNRTSAVLRGETSQTYARNEEANRYDEIGTYDISCSYDEAGNTTVDENGYQYFYGYENRIVKIEKPDGSGGGFEDVAEMEYDALGRRIQVKDALAAADEKYKRFYYDGQRVLLETGINDTLTTETDDRYFVFGNYIDEPLVMTDDLADTPDDHYYGHDHLFSAVVLFDSTGTVEERYEYDAYGKCAVLDADLTADADGLSDIGNPYTFTGRRLDIFDSGSFEIMYYRARYYDTNTGRFLQRDPLGINPAGGKQNPFKPRKQYTDGMSLYEYVKSNPVGNVDMYGSILTPVIKSYRNPGLFGHAGILVGNSDVDFGPKDKPGEWSYTGRCPYSGKPHYDTEYTTLKMKKGGMMLAGPKDGQKCCKLTLRNAGICVKYVCNSWNNRAPYIPGARDCRSFVSVAKALCCLE